MELKTNLSQWDTVLKKLVIELKDRHDLMTALGGTMLDAVETNFQNQGRPAWQGWSPAYAKKRQGGKILQKTGRLAASIRMAITNSSVTVGSNVRYARIHNEGGEIKHPERSHNLYFKQSKSGEVGRQFVKKRNANFVQSATIGAHTVNMPARPFLQLIDSDIEKLQDTAIRYFATVID